MMLFWVVTALYTLSLYLILRHNEKLKREIYTLNETVIFSEEEYKNLMKIFHKVKEGKQSIIEALRKDIEELNRYQKEQEYVHRYTKDQLHKELFEKKRALEYIEYVNNELVKEFQTFKQSVFYDPKRNEIIVLEDLTKLGEL